MCQIVSILYQIFVSNFCFKFFKQDHQLTWKGINLLLACSNGAIILIVLSYHYFKIELVFMKLFLIVFRFFVNNLSCHGYFATCFCHLFFPSILLGNFLSLTYCVSYEIWHYQKDRRILNTYLQYIPNYITCHEYLDSVVLLDGSISYAPTCSIGIFYMTRFAKSRKVNYSNLILFNILYNILFSDIKFQ